MAKENRSIINILDLSIEELDHLMDLADNIEKNKEEYWERCKHKKLATLFFEPSTRTRLSFEAAMLEFRSCFLQLFNFVLRQLQLLRRNQNIAIIGVTEHGVNQGMYGTTKFQVSTKTDG